MMKSDSFSRFMMPSMIIIIILSIHCKADRNRPRDSNEDAYRGELQCSPLTTVSGVTTQNTPYHYYSLRIRNSYQLSIQLSTCGSQFIPDLFIYASNGAIDPDLGSPTDSAMVSADRPLISCINTNEIDINNACSACNDGTRYPNNHRLEWTAVCTGDYYIQIGGDPDSDQIGEYVLTLSGCEDTPSSAMQSLYIRDTLTCDNNNKYGVTGSSNGYANSEWSHFYSIQMDEYQTSLLVSNCGSSFDTKLMIYSYNGYQLNSCSDDCGYCSLNEEVILNGICPGKYIVEIAGFSELDYGDYKLSITCGGNGTLGVNPGDLLANDEAAVYWTICGFIVTALCCLTVSVSLIASRKRQILRHRAEMDANARRMAYAEAMDDDLETEEDQAARESLMEGGEEMFDSEVERNIIKYNVRGHTIISDDDGNPPVAFRAGHEAGGLDDIDERQGEDSYSLPSHIPKQRSIPTSFELIHHEFNPSYLRKES